MEKWQDLKAQEHKENLQKGQGNCQEEDAMSVIDTRRKIKEIADISSFYELLDKTLLSEEEKTLLKLHYIQSKDFRYIGDMLGYSESTIKKRQKRITNSRIIISTTTTNSYRLFQCRDQKLYQSLGIDIHGRK